MSEMGDRLRKLRVSIGLSQAKLATVVGIGQATINRYETGNASPSLKMLTWYADYFNVSMDYLCCRTDKPEGKLYEFKPKAFKDNKEIHRFVEMCFDPKSLMYERLKETLIGMLGEAKQ